MKPAIILDEEQDKILKIGMFHIKTVFSLWITTVRPDSFCILLEISWHNTSPYHGQNQ